MANNNPQKEPSSSSRYYAPFEKTFIRIIEPFEAFIHAQTTSGILLMLTAVIALLIANSPFNTAYLDILQGHFGFHFGDLIFEKTLHHWINDGLMAIYFFIIGLEIKREILAGELADVRKAALPIFAAIGGMAIPAVLYYAINHGQDTVVGWGIPMATDIAFAVGTIALLGKRVPKSLLMFLVAVAIVDDLGAVMVIALFYTEQLSMNALFIAAVIMIILVLFNLSGIRKPLPYFLLGMLLWLALLKSGVHATLAGILTALTIPSRRQTDIDGFTTHMKSLLERIHATRTGKKNIMNNPEQSAVLQSMSTSVAYMQTPLQRLEHDMHLPVIYLVIPIFALANAGVVLDMESIKQALVHPITGGIMLGLVVGKLLGISLFSWLAVKLGIARLPSGTNFVQIAGVGLLAGIGFTMSIFIAELGFAQNPEYLVLAKTGILFASVTAGVLGALVLSFAARKKSGASSDHEHVT